MKNFIKSLCIILLLLVSTSVLFAQTQGGPANGQGTQGGTQQAPTNVTVTLPNPFRANNLLDLTRSIINDILIPIGGILAVMAFIFSGFKYVTAQGDESKIKEATRALWYTVIGTAVLLGAWAIMQVIQNTISQLSR